MNILLFCFISSSCLFYNTKSFRSPIHKIVCRNSLLVKNHLLILFVNKKEDEYKEKEKEKRIIITKKCNSLWKLTRPINIFPTFLLSFCGSWIIQPSTSLLTSKKFWITSLITNLIMSSSMVINDIYDMKIDKINHHERPLINGDLTKTEAILFTGALISITEYLNIHFLSSLNQGIIHSIILFIFLYSPVFKKITFIKNISCASLISFSLFFSSMTPNIMLSSHKNFGLLAITMSILFLASWYNELLLDMYDLEGDKQNKISTVPVVFGNDFSWVFAHIILTYNTISNVLSFYYLYDPFRASLLFVIFLPFYQNLYHIKKMNYDKQIIRKTVYNTSKSLFILLFYICSLSTL